MVSLLPDFPPHVAAYRAQGTITEEEYQSIVMTRVNEVAAHYSKINFLVLLETDIETYSSGALAEYLKLSFRHFTRWNRMAIVTDEKWVRKAYDTLSPLVPGEIRSYKTEAYEHAKEWVSQPL